MDNLTIRILTVVSCILILTGIGVLVYRKNPTSPVNRNFFFFNLSIAFWNSGELWTIHSFPDISTALYINRLSQIGGPLAVLFYIWFTVALADRTEPSRPIRLFLKIITPIFSIAALTPAILKETQISERGYVEELGFLGPVLGLYVVWGLLYGNYRLIRAYRSSVGIQRVRIRSILAALAMITLAGLSYATGLFLSDAIPLYYIGEVGYTTLIAYAIVRHGAMDIQTVIHKTVMWAVLSSLVFGPILGVLWLTRPWLRDLPTWLVAALALGMFYVVMLYYRTVQPRIDHLFERRKYDLQEELERLLGRLAVLGDRELLVAQIERTVGETLYANRVELFFPDEERGGGFRSSGGRPLGDEEFLDWLRGRPQVVEAERLEALEMEERELAEDFFRVTGLAAVAPLVTGHEFAGLIGLWPKRNLKPYSGLDIRFLERLRVEAAIALSNASLYDRVMRLNTELTQLNTQLEMKVRERTAELEEANRRLSDSNRRIAEADRMKTQFLANMSHELRTPLNSIIGFSKVLLKGIEGPLTHKQREDLEAVHRSGQHLLGLISDILDLTKIEAGKMELQSEAVEVGEVIRGVMSTAQALVKDRPVDLKVEMASQLPVISGDPMRLRQVVLNLVSNAIKFTDRGEVEVRAEPRGAYLVISVRDTGCGIRPGDQGKLFEEFRQLDGGGKGGTGLGLAISKRLVQLHGGEIWVDSQPGEGSTFSFSLPIVPVYGVVGRIGL
jgi:signal transduction histidine kinase